MKGGCGKKIGNSKYVSVWYNIRLENEPLCLIIEEIDPVERIWNVADILHQDGRWNLERLTTVLPPHIKEKIIQVHPQINVDVEDALAWKGSN